MARPNRQSVDYFPHQCNHGKTMFILEQKWGNDGYSFWFKLLEILGSSDGHYICLGNPSTREFLVAKTHLEVDLCYRILDLLAELEAIDRDLWETEKVIWCQNLVDNVGGVYQKRRANLPQKPSFRNQKPRTSDVSGAETPHSKVSDAETPQSKVKESKVKETKETPKGIPVKDLSEKAKIMKAQIEKAFNEQFWPQYPRKVAKREAFKAFEKLFPLKYTPDDCNRVLKNIGVYLANLKAEKRPIDKTPYPATFLNREDFSVEPEPIDTGEYEFVEVEA